MTVFETCSCFEPMGKIDRPGEGVSLSLQALAEGRAIETERGVSGYGRGRERSVSEKACGQIGTGSEATRVAQ